MITLYNHTSRQQAFVVLMNHVVLECNLDGLSYNLFMDYHPLEDPSTLHRRGIESFRTCRPHGEIGLLVLSIYREILITLLLYLKYSNYWVNKFRGSNRCRFLFHMEYDCPLRSQRWLANIGFNLDDMSNLIEKSNNYFFSTSFRARRTGRTNSESTSEFVSLHAETWELLWKS